MSVSLAVGQVKSKADLLRKELDYRKYLRLQAKLNKEAEKVPQMPILPPLPLDIPTEKEMDVNVMRNQIKNRLIPILGDKETGLFLGRYLRASDDLRVFYNLMDEFIPILRFDRPLNANYLFNIYTRWLQRRKASTEVSGGGYASLSPTIQTEVDRMGYGIKDYILQTGLSPSETLKYIQKTEDAMRAFDYATLEKMAGGRL